MTAAIEIYTDGACSGNPGPGGFGIVMLYKGKRKEISEGYKLTTNNRMELMSVCVALETLKGEGWQVIVYSDSKYVVDAIEKRWLDGWIRKNFNKVKNPDLWMRFYRIYKKHAVKFIWVKGHAGNLENNRCDELAVAASKGTKLFSDFGFEKIKSSGLYEE
jgi:ribonuclease HI